jgi:Derlin-2/3
MAFAFTVHGTIPKDEICGVVVGHSEFLLMSNNTVAELMKHVVWYYFNDIYPPTHGNHRPLDPPNFWIRLWEARPVEEEVETEDDVQQNFAAVPIPGLQ